MGTNRRNIALLFAAAFLQGMVFYSPVATLYRFSCGLSLTEMGLIESVSLGTMLALERPWGRWADALGHRRTIVLCSFLFALSKVVFWRVETFAGFLAERLLLAVCLSGLSGCDSAFLFLCCRGEEHRRVFAQWQAVQTAGMLFSALCWPLMGGDYRRSAALTVLSYTAAALLTLALREPEGERAEEQRRDPSPAPAALLRGTAPLIPFLLAFCLFDQTCQMGVVFLSQLQYRRTGPPPHPAAEPGGVLRRPGRGGVRGLPAAVGYRPALDGRGGGGASARTALLCGPAGPVGAERAGGPRRPGSPALLQCHGGGPGGHGPPARLWSRGGPGGGAGLSAGRSLLRRRSGAVPGRRRPVRILKPAAALPVSPARRD